MAGGDFTPATLEIQSLCICLVAGELNCLKIMVGDISSAYLEAFTHEKDYYIAGPEFGELKGHILSDCTNFRCSFGMIALQTYFVQWGKADPDEWLKDCGTHYKNTCVYADYLMVIGQNPEVLMEALTTK